jgi:predicted transposase YbfD/YdcC
VAFPFAEQAARLTRCVDSARKPAKEIETEYLLSSRPAAQMNAEQMLKADRKYWGIETGLHLRLDVIAGEDRSRVRKPNAVMNLAVIRRAVVSLAVHWIGRCKDRRQASMSGFYDFMSAQGGKRALKLVTIAKPTWLPDC